MESHDQRPPSEDNTNPAEESWTSVKNAAPVGRVRLDRSSRARSCRGPPGWPVTHQQEQPAAQHMPYGSLEKCVATFTPWSRMVALDAPPPRDVWKTTCRIPKQRRLRLVLGLSKYFWCLDHTQCSCSQVIGFKNVMSSKHMALLGKQITSGLYEWLSSNVCLTNTNM